MGSFIPPHDLAPREALDSRLKSPTKTKNTFDWLRAQAMSARTLFVSMLRASSSLGPRVSAPLVNQTANYAAKPAAKPAAKGKDAKKGKTTAPIGIVFAVDTLALG